MQSVAIILLLTNLLETVVQETRRVPWFPSQWSVLEAFVALAAVGSFVRLFLLRPKIELYIGDTVGVVWSRGKARKLQLWLSVINVGGRSGSLNFVRLCLREPENVCKNLHFDWRIFFDPIPGVDAVKKREDCHPVPVLAGNSCILPIEFEPRPEHAQILETHPRIHLVVEGWVSRKKLTARPDIKGDGKFTVQPDEIARARKQSAASEIPVVCKYRRIEWQD